MATELTEAEVEALLSETELRLDRVRALYDSYFMGYEKIPPHTLQKDVVRAINQLQHTRVKRTVLKFRIQTLIQRFGQLRTLWARTEREIEEGRYARHRNRAARRDQAVAESGELTAREAQEVEAIRSRLGDEAAEDAKRKRLEGRPQPAGGGAKSAPIAASTEAGEEAAAFLASLGGSPPPAAQTAPDGSEGQSAEGVRGVSADELSSAAARIKFLQQRFGLRQPAVAAAAPPSPPDPTESLYRRLMDTKRSLNEDTSQLDIERFRRSLDKQREAIREKHQCRAVDFDVVVKDGKAYVKPIPRS